MENDFSLTLPSTSYRRKADKHLKFEFEIFNRKHAFYEGSKQEKDE